MTRFVAFVFVMILLLRFVIAKLASQNAAKRLRQRAGVAEQFKRAAVEQVKREQLPSRGAPLVPPSTHAHSSPLPTPPTPPTPPAPQMPPAMQVDPTVVTPEPEADTTLSSSLDTSLSTTLGSPMAEPDHAVVAGPQVVALSPDLEHRVKELMEQNYEVLAVRLLCDELRIGILDAQKTVRTLVGLPTTY